MKTQTQTLDERIRQIIDVDCINDANVLVDLILPTLTEHEIRNLLHNRITHVLRTSVLRVERRVFSPFVSRALIPSRPLNNTVSDVLEDLAENIASRRAELRVLAAREIALGDGTRTTWGKMILEEYLQRIAMLRRQRDGIDQTIRQLEMVAQLLVREGVTCLDEYLAKLDEEEEMCA